MHIRSTFQKIVGIIKFIHQVSKFYIIHQLTLLFIAPLHSCHVSPVKSIFLHSNNVFFQRIIKSISCFYCSLACHWLIIQLLFFNFDDFSLSMSFPFRRNLLQCRRNRTLCGLIGYLPCDGVAAPSGAFFFFAKASLSIRSKSAICFSNASLS